MWANLQRLPKPTYPSVHDFVSAIQAAWTSVSTTEDPLSVIGPLILVMALPVSIGLLGPGVAWTTVTYL